MFKWSKPQLPKWGNLMREIGRCKVQGKTPKPGITYPFIRFPQENADLIGKHMRIFAIESNGHRAFVLVEEGGAIPQVGQLELTGRIDELEMRIKKLEELGPLFSSDPSGAPPEGSDSDGPGRIRTGDLRRVRATS